MSAGHGEKLTRKQSQLITALLTEVTISGAAKKVGIGEATARRWMHQPAFQAAYQEARQVVFEQTLTDLQRLAVSAVAALARNLKADAPPATQVRAAQVVLEHAKAGIDLQELLRRIERLEELLEARPALPRRLA